MNKPVTVIIGSNCEDRHRCVACALDFVETIIDVKGVSPLIDMPDFTGVGADYLNRVVVGVYSGEIDKLLRELTLYEDSHGRIRMDYKNVTVDIDIVTFDGKVIKPKEYFSEPYRLGLEMIKTAY